MKLLTQEIQVVNQLKSYGKVTRNWCLQQRITRCGAIIDRLHKKGWNITGHYLKTDHGKDYVYELVSTPAPNKYQLFHQKMQQL